MTNYLLQEYFHGACILPFCIMSKTWASEATTETSYQQKWNKTEGFCVPILKHFRWIILSQNSEHRSTNENTKTVLVPCSLQMCEHNIFFISFYYLVQDLLNIYLYKYIEQNSFKIQRVIMGLLKMIILWQSFEATFVKRPILVYYMLRKRLY